MREIRTFEMERGEPAAAWRMAWPSVVTVESGTLWITIECDADDYWLQAGDSLRLPGRMRAWIGAESASARFVVADTHDEAAPRWPNGRRPSRLQPAWWRAAFRADALAR